MSLPSSSFTTPMPATQQGMLTNIPVSHRTPTSRPDETEKEIKGGTTFSRQKRKKKDLHMWMIDNFVEY